MRLFQIVNGAVSIIKDNQYYSDTVENYILDGGIIEKDDERMNIAVHDDQQNYCEVNGEVLEYPVEFFENIIDGIDELIAKKVEREYVAPTIDELKAQKLTELKTIRDTEEVKPIAYNGNLFDYDDKARERINAAIIALDVQTAQTKAVASIDWTTADNADVKVTADDLRCVIAAVAQRSNALHVAYRAAKDKVEQATTVAEVEAVTLDA